MPILATMTAMLAIKSLPHVLGNINSSTLSACRVSTRTDRMPPKALGKLRSIICHVAIPAKGVVTWEFLILILTHTGVVLGTLAIWSAQSVPSNRAMFGQFGSFSTSIDDCGIGHSLIWRSTASCAVVTS